MEKIDFKKQNIPFTQVANGVLYDKKLSLGAKTIYAFMYSKPDGWDFSSERIAKELGGVSKPTVLSHLRELESLGYLIKQRLSTGRMLYKLVFPPIEPQSRNFTMGNEPQSKKATVKKSHGEESLPVSNKESKVIKNTSNKDTEQSSGEINLLIKSFEGINPNAKNFYARNPQRKACSELISIVGFERIKWIIENTLPKTNLIDYLPTITTPIQLLEKWSSLEAGILRLKKKDKPKVAFQ